MRQRVIVAMLDGFGWEYWERSEMPNLRCLARDGFAAPGKAVFPTCTNVNNISIACWCWPERHGVATNCYFDAATGTAELLEDASFLRCPTPSAAGVKSALLTCKGKTLGILGPDVELGLAAETLSGNLLERYRTPPPMYSAEINYWLWDCAIDILRNRPDIGFIYAHTTDYPMHRWAPDDPEIVLCDEIVSALDVSVQSQILRLLEEIQKRRGMGIVFISHDLRVIRHMADEILMVKSGGMIEYDSASEIRVLEKRAS